MQKISSSVFMGRHIRTISRKTNYMFEHLRFICYSITSMNFINWCHSIYFYSTSSLENIDYLNLNNKRERLDFLVQCLEVIVFLFMIRKGHSQAWILTAWNDLSMGRKKETSFVKLLNSDYKAHYVPFIVFFVNFVSSINLLLLLWSQD